MHWMQQEGILKHWILPEQGLNSGTQFANTPTGNAPKFNALDSNCNCDIHRTVLRHVSHTAHLQNTNGQFLPSFVGPIVIDQPSLGLGGRSV
eukprot:7374127-Ditylum_brightwellii.AAC.1